MAYDSRRHRMVLFGGYVQGVFASDTWEWNGKTWVQRSSSGPSARGGCACAYDPRHRMTIVFGGTTESNTSGATSETWGWSSAKAWTLLSSGGPGGRMYAHMAYDPGRRQLVLFGGCDNSGKLLGDTWTWSGRAWNRMPKGDAIPRTEQAMTYHGGIKQIVMLGGVVKPEPASDSGQTMFDYMAWNGSRWVRLKTTTEPPARRAPMLTYDSKRHSLVLFGGEAHNRTRDFLGDTWLSAPPR